MARQDETDDSKARAFPFGCCGFAFGFLFLAAGIWLERIVTGMTLSVTEVYARNPVQFIVASAPLVIGGVSYAFGSLLEWIAAQMAEIEAARNENRHLARHDPLTGLPNRLQFSELVARLAGDGEQGPFAVLCIDLDRFKAVNDTYGHAVGDGLLKMMADLMRAAALGSGGVARLGGHEFVIWRTDIADREGARVFVSDFATLLNGPFEVEGVRIDAGASLGVALYPEDGRTMSELLGKADRAMYRAKGLTCQRFEFHHPDEPGMRCPSRRSAG